jgi:hypothetical protein
MDIAEMLARQKVGLASSRVELAINHRENHAALRPAADCPLPNDRIIVLFRKIR